MDSNYNNYDDGGIEYESKNRAPLVYSGEFSGSYDDDYRAAVLEQIRLAKIRRREADKRARDKLRAEIIIVLAAIIVIILICSVIIHIGKRKQESAQFVNIKTEDSSAAEELEDITEQMEKNTNEVISEKSPFPGEAVGHKLVQIDGVTYVDGIMIVNKTFALPQSFAPGLQPEAEEAFNNMAAAAWGDGVSIWICSGYRSFEDQDALFREYASVRGLEEADEVSARPGHSEHQSGLAFDVNSTDFSFAGTTEAWWLEQNCADYGFIIRFPEGKEKITGYDYEPWHIRFVGVKAAKAMKESGQCLEEYLNVTSDYNNYDDNKKFLEKYSEYADISAPDEEEAADGQGYDDYYGTDQYYDYNYDYNYGY